MASVVDLSDKPVALQGIAAPGYNAVDLRRLASTWLPQEGVVDGTDFKAVPGGGAKTISVPGGQAAVEGDSTAQQSRYYLRHTGAAIVVDLATAPDATNPRIDQVVLEVKDDAHDGSGLNTARVRVITGTPTAGTTLDSRAGAAALPVSCVRILDVLVPAGFNAVFVAATHFRDRRPFARGARRVIARTSGGPYTRAIASVAEIDSVNLKPRIECSGCPMRVRLLGQFNFNNTAAGHVFELWQDGASVEHHDVSHADNGGTYIIPGEFEITPVAGSHTFSPAFMGAVTGTLSVPASAVTPLKLVVEELVRQNADNS